MSDPARISEIANKIAEIVTNVSGSPPPPTNTVPNATDVSTSVHLQPPKEIINQEEQGEVNPENASGTTTLFDFPSTSREQRGDRIPVFIGQGMASMANSKYSRIFNDPAIQLLTKVLFCPGEPDQDDVNKVKNSLLSREQVNQFKKAMAAQNSTKNPSPADKQN